MLPWMTKTKDHLMTTIEKNIIRSQSKEINRIGR